jgi:DNA-binding CsgD family transcriptional regulator
MLLETSHTHIFDGINSHYEFAFKQGGVASSKVMIFSMPGACSALARNEPIAGTMCMGDATEVSAILENLYDSIFEPGRMADALGSIERWLGSDLCHLVGTDREEKSVCLSLMTDTTLSHSDAASVQKAYANHFHLLDPRRRIARQAPAGQVFTCSDYFDNRYVQRSEFYQDFLRSFGGRYIAGGCLVRNETQEIYVAFNHMLGRAPFTEDDMARIRWITPHLQRAVTLLFQTSTFRAGLLAGEHGLDALDHGVVVLDRHDAIIFTNERARILLEEKRAVQSRSNRLAASREGKLLEDTLARVRASRHPESVTLRTMTASDTGIQKYYLTVLGVPLDGHDSIRPSGLLNQSSPIADRPNIHGPFSILPSADLIVLISSPRRSTTVSAKQLMQLFQLSPAEARLAHALGKGLSMEEYADEACVGLPTVRTHLRSVLKKTSERRQQDLVRMLASLPGIGPNQCVR